MSGKHLERYPFLRRPEDTEPPCPEFPSFIEKLFLALLVAEPRLKLPKPPASPDAQLRQRVSTAAKALFGESLAGGGQAYGDLQWFFGATLTTDGAGVIVARPENKPPGKQQNEILSEFDQPEEARAAKLTTYLRNAAESQGVDLGTKEEEEDSLSQARDRIKNYFPYLNSVEGRDKHPEEKAMLESLIIISEELLKWDLHMNLDPVHLRLASFWDEEAQPPDIVPQIKRTAGPRRKRTTTSS